MRSELSIRRCRASGEPMASTIFQEWKGYERATLGRRTTPQGREVCRRAFYAGAISMFKLMQYAAVGTSEDCDRAIRALDRELYAMDFDIAFPK